MEKSTIRVLIVDNYEPWRRFILSSVQNWAELQVVGEVSDGWEAVWKSRQLQPDIILLDIGLPTMNVIEAARQIRQQSPNAKTLFCSENLSPEVEVAEAALRAGAGYLVKSDAGSDLLPAVFAIIGGKRFVSRTLAGHAFAETSDSGLRDQGHVVQFS